MNCTVRIVLLTCALCFIEATQYQRLFGDRKTAGIPTKDKTNDCRPYGRQYGDEVSVSVYNRPCVNWSLIPNKRYLAPSLRKCNHNYCRNPDNSVLPWCVVKKGKRYVREYCIENIPRETKPTKRPQKPNPPKQDTESTCGEKNLRMSKIIGGLRSSVESQPWTAAIFVGGGLSCGGTLIAPCWVLTAAHCFPLGEGTKIKKYSVYLGKNAINETDSDEQKFSVSKLVIHSDFDYSTQNYTHDIALLKIENSDGQCATKTKTVRTACLPPFQQMVPSGFYCDIAGYGRHQKGGTEYSRYLKTAQVKLISQSDCQKYYSKEEVNENMFCAVGRNWKDDACQGDSGGPLLCEINNTVFLFGIISWGKDCAEVSNPGVYTKVTNYNHWIAQHTGLPAYTAGSRYPRKD